MSQSLPHSVPRAGTLERDTIVAIATPPGRGGIGIVRLSGPLAGHALLPVLSLTAPTLARYAYFTRIHDPRDRSLLDQAVVTFFPAPASYTGEDVLEVASHGAPVILEFLVAQALAGGARLASPGEFTQRAFLNGRLGLTEAEAVRDLIDASTLHQARLAAEQLGGALSRRIAPIKQSMIRLIATLEAGIDFAEDDIDILPTFDILAHLTQLELPLRNLADSYRYGQLVHTGLKLAIVGPPNAGKSSLFNRLIDRDRAIVTPTPGTTRDLITERVSLGGIPVTLIDTAGLRETADEAETLGIAKTHEAVATADLVLFVTVLSTPLEPSQQALLRSLEGRPVLLIYNKADLVPVEHAPNAEGIATSAITGLGIDDLQQAILAFIGQTSSAEMGIITSLRQQQAITRATDALHAARQAVERSVPHEMVLLDLKGALQALDDLTGVTTPDDILNLIFSTFCIGK